MTKFAANSRVDVATRGFVEEALSSVNSFQEVGLLLGVVQVGGAVDGIASLFGVSGLAVTVKPTVGIARMSQRLFSWLLGQEARSAVDSKNSRK